MVRISYAPLVDDVSGKIGKVVFSKYKRTDKAYIHRARKHSPTHRQLTTRAKFQRGRRLWKFIEGPAHPAGFLGPSSLGVFDHHIGLLSWKVAALGLVSQEAVNPFMAAWMAAPYVGAGADTGWSPFANTGTLGDLPWTVTVTPGAGRVSVTVAGDAAPAGRDLRGWVWAAIDARWRQDSQVPVILPGSSIHFAADLPGGGASSVTGVPAGEYLVYVSGVSTLNPFPYLAGELQWNPVKAARVTVT